MTVGSRMPRRETISPSGVAVRRCSARSSSSWSRVILPVRMRISASGVVRRAPLTRRMPSSWKWMTFFWPSRRIVRYPLQPAIESVWSRLEMPRTSTSPLICPIVSAHLLGRGRHFDGVALPVLGLDVAEHEEPVDGAHRDVSRIHGSVDDFADRPPAVDQGHDL